jgi:NAD(P)-dependent dehydrogenase (short-subunit alcohol dehydrogenase family)
VNYLSQHYLTTLLLQQLIESEGKSNIVNVSSPLYKVAKDEKVLHEQWNDEAKYQIAHAYGYSKLALMMDSYQLNKNLIQQNLSDQVSINCVNPGGVDSQIFRNLGTRAGWFLSILKMAGQLKDAEAAAEYIINVCQEPKSGGYYDEWTRRELDAVIPKYNLARAHELWNQAELVTNK